MNNIQTYPDIPDTMSSTKALDHVAAILAFHLFDAIKTQPDNSYYDLDRKRKTHNVVCDALGIRNKYQIYLNLLNL